VSGRLRLHEEIEEGIDAFPTAPLELLSGAHFGTLWVSLGETGREAAS